MRWKERLLLLFVATSMALIAATVVEAMGNSKATRTESQQAVVSADGPTATSTVVRPTSTPAPTRVIQATRTPLQGVEDTA